MKIWLIVLCLCVGLSSALAVEPGEELSDPALEERARALSAELRCLVCQNQSIDDSNAGLARDLRLLVRERLVAGDSDAEVQKFLVDRYGDFVLLRPPVKPATYALWYSPAAILFAAILFLAAYFRRHTKRETDRAVPPLSAAEHASLEQIMAEDQRT